MSNPGARRNGPVKLRLTGEAGPGARGQPGRGRERLLRVSLRLNLGPERPLRPRREGEGEVFPPLGAPRAGLGVSGLRRPPGPGPAAAWANFSYRTPTLLVIFPSSSRCELERDCHTLSFDLFVCLLLLFRWGF